MILKPARDVPWRGEVGNGVVKSSSENIVELVSSMPLLPRLVPCGNGFLVLRAVVLDSVRSLPLPVIGGLDLLVREPVHVEYLEDSAKKDSVDAPVPFKLECLLDELAAVSRMLEPSEGESFRLSMRAMPNWEVEDCEAVVFIQLECCPPATVLVLDSDFPGALTPVLCVMASVDDDSIAALLLSGNPVPLLSVLVEAK